ncbi:hypothetical protein ABT010_39605 [Streptomyces sp. NPDC002668]|uniref:hypothetical protein n=1 Tax=Streptomyces sp. NPDC002668 TaxID=3154422 RepID=UPI00331CEDD8
MSDRPLTGVGSWSDFIAIDGAYDAQSKTYMPDTKQARNGSDLRLRQIKSALQTLKGLGPERALVPVPRARNGSRRLYGEFSLMRETGRGGHQTPDTYTVPENHFALLESLAQVCNTQGVRLWRQYRPHHTVMVQATDYAPGVGPHRHAAPLRGPGAVPAHQ